MKKQVVKYQVGDLVKYLGRGFGNGLAIIYEVDEKNEKTCVMFFDEANNPLDWFWTDTMSACFSNLTKKGEANECS